VSCSKKIVSKKIVDSRRAYQFNKQLAPVQLRLVKLLYSPRAVLLLSEFHHAAPLGATLIILEDINSNNITNLAHMVFQVFPLGFKAEIGHKDTTAFHIPLVFCQISFVKHLVSNYLSSDKLLVISGTATLIKQFDLPPVLGLVVVSLLSLLIMVILSRSLVAT